MQCSPVGVISFPIGYIAPTSLFEERRSEMAKKFKSPQSLSIILGGGIVAITVVGFAFALAGAGLPLAGELFAGLAGMAAGARIA